MSCALLGRLQRVAVPNLTASGSSSAEEIFSTCTVVFCQRDNGRSGFMCSERVAAIYPPSCANVCRATRAVAVRDCRILGASRTDCEVKESCTTDDSSSTSTGYQCAAVIPAPGEACDFAQGTFKLTATDIREVIRSASYQTDVFLTAGYDYVAVEGGDFIQSASYSLSISEGSPAGVYTNISVEHGTLGIDLADLGSHENYSGSTDCSSAVVRIHMKVTLCQTSDDPDCEACQ